MLYERMGLSKDKAAVLEPYRKGSGLKPADVFRSAYCLAGGVGVVVGAACCGAEDGGGAGAGISRFIKTKPFIR